MWNLPTTSSLRIRARLSLEHSSDVPYGVLESYLLELPFVPLFHF